MTQRAVIENKISAARKYLKLLDRYKGHSRATIEEDVDIRGALERYLYLAVQAAIDLGEAIISLKELRKPTTTAEAFDILCEAGIIPPELAQRLVKMVGFRNVMAHDYEAVNYDIVYDVLHNRLADIEEFLKKVASI